MTEKLKSTEGVLYLLYKTVKMVATIWSKLTPWSPPNLIRALAYIAYQYCNCIFVKKMRRLKVQYCTRRKLQDCYVYL